MNHVTAIPATDQFKMIGIGLGFDEALASGNLYQFCMQNEAEASIRINPIEHDRLMLLNPQSLISSLCYSCTMTTRGCIRE